MIVGYLVTRDGRFLKPDAPLKDIMSPESWAGLNVPAWDCLFRSFYVADILARIVNGKVERLKLSRGMGEGDDDGTV